MDNADSRTVAAEYPGGLLTVKGQLDLLQILAYDLSLLRRLVAHVYGEVEIDAIELEEMRARVPQLEVLQQSLYEVYSLAATTVCGPTH